MKFSKLWQAVLAVWLIVGGLIALGWISFRGSGDILGIAAIVAGVLLLINK